MAVLCGPRELEQRCSLAGLASNCYTVRHSTAPQVANLVAMASESTCYACKCEVSIERTKFGSFITLAPALTSCLMATVLGLVQETQIGDVEHVEWMEIWATRTVCKWSKNLMWLWCIWTEELGQFGLRVHLEFACVAVCSLLLRHHGSHA